MLEDLVKNLNRRKFDARYFVCGKEALQAILNEIPDGSVVGAGGSQTLREIGVKEEDLEALSEAAMADVCTGGNPRPCSKELVWKVYKTAFNGK